MQNDVDDGPIARIKAGAYQLDVTPREDGALLQFYEILAPELPRQKVTKGLGSMRLDHGQVELLIAALGGS